MSVSAFHQSTQSNGTSTASQNQTNASNNDASTSVRHLNRNSLPVDMDFNLFKETKTTQSVTSPSSSAHSNAPKLQSSYSASDIPAMKNTNGVNQISSTSNSHAQQHFHNHNASLGRIPPNAVNNRHSRDLSGGESQQAGRDNQANSFQSFQSALQANAAPFGPPLSQLPSSVGTSTPPNMSTYTPQFYSGYGMQQMMLGMHNLQMGQIGSQMYPPQNPYGTTGFGGIYTPNGARDSQTRVIQQRRLNDGEGESFDHTTRMRKTRD
jgi:hypothetical protein